MSGCSAFALPPIPGYILQALEGQKDYQAYAADLKASTTKCASCHIPGGDKKAKGHALNDFGQAVHKHLDDKAFMAADKAKFAATDEAAKAHQNAIALKLFAVAWGQAVQEKNEAGKVFNDLLKAGKLPGKNPEKKE